MVLGFDGYNHVLSIPTMHVNTDCFRLELGKRNRKGATTKTGVAYIEHFNMS